MTFTCYVVLTNIIKEPFHLRFNQKFEIKTFDIQWKPLNVIALEQANINQMITITDDFYSAIIKNKWDLLNIITISADDINCDHIKRLPL